MLNKIAIIALCVLVGTLAYFRATDTKDIQKEIDKSKHFCPNATQRVREPVPHGPDAIRQEDLSLVAVAADVDKKLPLRTTAYVVY